MIKKSRTRIKICGLTNSADIAHAVEIGTDALGFVFYPPSKRYVTPELAALLTKNLPAFVSTVALFVNPADEQVQSVVDAMHPTLLQFHGDESPEQCSSFGLPYLKAFRAGAPGLDTAESLAHKCSSYDQAAGWLFDSYTPAYGGSGHSFDYGLLANILQPEFKARPIIISGGLNEFNVAKAIKQLHPWAVDVSSGVELSPGLKSADKMDSFISAVQLAG